MNISLLKPPIGGIIGLEMITFVEPLGLECVAGGIEPEGHRCQIVDLRIDGLEPGIEKCRRFEPEIVGIQCNFTTERFRTLTVAKRIREVLPQAMIVVGFADSRITPLVTQPHDAEIVTAVRATDLDDDGRAEVLYGLGDHSLVLLRP